MELTWVHAERPETIPDIGIAAFRYLQLFSPAPAARSAWSEGDGRGRAGTGARTASGAGLRLRSDARACSSARQRAAADSAGPAVESGQADDFAQAAWTARELLARALLRQ